MNKNIKEWWDGLTTKQKINYWFNYQEDVDTLSTGFEELLDDEIKNIWQREANVDNDDSIESNQMNIIKSYTALKIKQSKKHYVDKSQSHDEISISEIRKAVANYMYSEGCSCCRNSNHDENGKKLATLLRVDKYEDDSGFDWFKYRDK